MLSISPYYHGSKTSQFLMIETALSEWVSAREEKPICDASPMTPSRNFKGG